jgi:hypothetical protein
MNWGRTMKKALQSNGLPTEFFKWHEMAADRINGVLFTVLNSEFYKRDTDLLTTRHLG